MSSGKCRPSCIGLNVLTRHPSVITLPPDLFRCRISVNCSDGKDPASHVGCFTGTTCDHPNYQQITLELKHFWPHYSQKHLKLIANDLTPIQFCIIIMGYLKRNSWHSLSNICRIFHTGSKEKGELNSLSRSWKYSRLLTCELTEVLRQRGTMPFRILTKIHDSDGKACHRHKSIQLYGILPCH